MSNVYILEPPTSGKVLLKTTVGDIDVELWTKEAPKTCRNFIQLCLEGYYNGTIFHRIVKGFIAQGGDPNGDGTGGESIYGGTFKDEFHQRLRFARRGLLAMANAGPDDNASQFFFTLAATPELQNKHTIFGKVTGETVFNMLKLEEGLIEDERPAYPYKIIKTEVLNNPFTDIEPRILESATKEKKKKKVRTPGVKNFKLLSFGAEAEEDEEETSRVNEKFSGKGKSTHDVLDDPKLSSETVTDDSSKKAEAEKTVAKKDDENDEDEDSDDPEERARRLESIRNKLKTGKAVKKRKPIVDISARDDWDDEHVDEKKKKYDEIKKEIESVKRDYHKNKLRKKDEEEKTEEEQKSKEAAGFKEYNDLLGMYKSKKSEIPRKGVNNEEFTLNLLSKFRNKLRATKESKQEEEEEKEQAEKAEQEVDDVEKDKNCFVHKLRCEEIEPVLAKDANTKDDDWFEIYDPRNPLNKRRRGATSKPATDSSSK